MILRVMFELSTSLHYQGVYLVPLSGLHSWYMFHCKTSCCDITAGGQPTDKGVITSPDGSVRFEVSCYTLYRV